MTPIQSSVRDLLRVPPGPVRLADSDARATPGAPGGRNRTKDALAEAGSRLADLQERLYAEGHVAEGEPSRCRLLLVLQGMDTSGKDGTIKHVLGAVNPLGCSITAFKKPTPAELRHDFLWRIRRRLPTPGMVGIFNRSHFEDVLVVRVHGLARPQVIEQRYGQINEFEEELTAAGRAAAGPAGRPHEALEVQPRRPERAEAVGGLPSGVRGRAGALQHRGRALVRRAGRSKVVPELGGQRPVDRDPPGDEPDLSAAGPRRRRTDPAARGGLARSGGQ